MRVYTHNDFDAANGQVRPLSGRSLHSHIAWADRCTYWAEQLIPVTRSDGRLKRNDRPLLVLGGHGVRLSVNHGSLMVRNGLTHYPQEREEWRLFPGEWRTPLRIVVLDARGGLTFDALRWLAEQNVQLVHLDWRGNVVHVVGGSGYSINQGLAEAQLAARENGVGLKLSWQLIAEKINNSIDTLRIAFPQSPAIEKTLRRLDHDVVEMKRNPPRSRAQLLGIEGRVAQAYFSAWRSFPLRWRGIGRHAIPEDWNQFSQRQSMAATKQTNRNRHASHPINAMLNYAYGLLRSHVHQRVVAAGLDPSVGYLHGNYGDRAALVYDLMEPLRPLVDRTVLEFANRHVFEAADFLLSSKGVCRLNPQLARSIVEAVHTNSWTDALTYTRMLQEVRRRRLFDVRSK